MSALITLVRQQMTLPTLKANVPISFLSAHIDSFNGDMLADIGAWKAESEPKQISDWSVFAYTLADKYAKIVIQRYQEERKKEIATKLSEMDVNWRQIQSKLNWIGTFIPHEVPYHLISYVPFISPEAKAAIDNYNDAVANLKAVMKKESKMYVEYRQTIKANKETNNGN